MVGPFEMFLYCFLALVFSADSAPLPTSAASEAVVAEFMTFGVAKWAKASEYLLQTLDQTKKPCENFFDHVCGKGKPKKKQDVIDETALSAIKNIDPKTLTYSDSELSLRSFFDACLNEGGKPNEQMETLSELWHKNAFLGRLPWSPKSFTGGNDSEELANKWMHIGLIDTVFRQRTIYDTYFFEGPVVLFEAGPIHAEFCVHGSESRKNVEGFLQKVNIPDVIKTVDAFCASMNSKSSSDPIEHKSDEYHVFNMSGIRDEHLKLFREDLFKVILGNETDIGSVEKLIRFYTSEDTQIFLHEFEAIVLNNHPIAALRVFVFFLLAEKMTLRKGSDEMGCLHKVKRLYGPVLAKLYLKHVAREVDVNRVYAGAKPPPNPHANITNWRYEFQGFVRNILSSLRFLIIAADFIGRDTKEKIHEKFDQMEIDYGLPDWIDDESEIEKRVFKYDSSRGFLEQVVEAERLLFQRSAELLLKQKQGAGFIRNGEYPSFEFKVEYEELAYRKMWMKPRLRISFGASLPPFYDKEYPMVVNYGGVGTAIAHALFHVIDYGNVAQSTEDNNPTEMPSLEVIKKQATCLKSQNPTGQGHGHGDPVEEQSLEEVNPEIAALTTTYTAYKFLSQLLGEEPPIPDLHNTSAEELLFISYARLWCENAQGRDSKNIHAFNKQSIDIVLKNIPLFSKAFHCPSDSQYVQNETCNAWPGIFQNQSEGARTSTTTGTTTSMSEESTTTQEETTATETNTPTWETTPGEVISTTEETTTKPEVTSTADMTSATEDTSAATWETTTSEVISTTEETTSKPEETSTAEGVTTTAETTPNEVPPTSTEHATTETETTQESTATETTTADEVETTTDQVQLETEDTTTTSHVTTTTEEVITTGVTTTVEETSTSSEETTTVVETTPTVIPTVFTTTEETTTEVETTASGEITTIEVTTMMDEMTTGTTSEQPPFSDWPVTTLQPCSTIYVGDEQCDWDNPYGLG